MSKPAVAALPRRSFAEHITFVTPSGKRAPEAGVHAVPTGPSTTSVAVALNVTITPARIVFTTLDGGTASVGGVLSATVIVKRRVVDSSSSVAVHVTEVGPIGKVDSEGGLHVTGIGRPLSSTADAAYVTAAPAKLEPPTVRSGGTVMRGGSPAVATGAATPARTTRVRTRRIIGSP